MGDGTVGFVRAGPGRPGLLAYGLTGGQKNDNALPLGLAAYVFSGDLERAWSMAEQIEAGAIGVNVNDTSDPQVPFGGWKMGGFGRELGPEGLHGFREKPPARCEFDLDSG